MRTVVLDSVSVRFGTHIVLNEVTATFEAGSMSAIMGPSGAGKSTLLGVIAGHVRPLSGQVRYTECAATDVKWLVQSSPLFLRRSALENAAISLLLKGVEFDLACTRGLRALHRVGLESRADEAVHRFSGGEKQRVAIARALASRSKAVLADEPTASLDSLSRSQVCTALIAMTELTQVVGIIATHDEYVAQQCDRRYVLDNGRLSERSER